MPILTANGIDIAYDVTGDASETVVLISGLGDEKESWALQTNDLVAAGYRVVSFDNRGVGGSDKPAGPYTIGAMAADAKAVVDALSLRDFHLVGYSMGGMIAQEYALAHGADLRSLSLVSTYAEPGPFCLRLFDSWAAMARTHGAAAAIRNVFLWCFTPAFYEDQAELAAAIDDEVGQLSATADGFLGQLAAIRNHHASARVAAIEAPTLVLAGEHDLLIPPRQSQRLHQAIAGAQWLTVPGGHAHLLEFPADFNAALLGFLAQHRAQ